MATPAPPRPRPLSPHLSHWRWGPNMLVSILHRITGHAMAFGAIPLLLWWLAAAASGEGAYRHFHDIASGPLGLIVGIGFTWVFFQHLANGVRHLVMDAGAGFEIERNKASAQATLLFSLLMTLALWGFVLLRKGAL